MIASANLIKLPRGWVDTTMKYHHVGLSQCLGEIRRFLHNSPVRAHTAEDVAFEITSAVEHSFKWQITGKDFWHLGDKPKKYLRPIVTIIRITCYLQTQLSSTDLLRGIPLP